MSLCHAKIFLPKRVAMGYFDFYDMDESFVWDLNLLGREYSFFIRFTEKSSNPNLICIEIEEENSSDSLPKYMQAIEELEDLILEEYL